MKIEKLYQRYLRLVEELKKEKRLDVTVARERPAKLETIERYEEKHDLRFPDDLKVFWTLYDRDLSIAIENDEDDFAAGGLSFVTFSIFKRDRDQHHEAAAAVDEGSFDRALYRHGLFFTFERPQLVYLEAPGWEPGVFQLYQNQENQNRPITRTFTELFEAYLDAGCFCSHDIGFYWSAVKDLLPAGRPPSENPWLLYYAESFDQTLPD